MSFWKGQGWKILGGHQQKKQRVMKIIDSKVSNLQIQKIILQEILEQEIRNFEKASCRLFFGENWFQNLSKVFFCSW